MVLPNEIVIKNALQLLNGIFSLFLDKKFFKIIINISEQMDSVN